MKNEEIIHAVAELDGFQNIDNYLGRGVIPFVQTKLMGNKDGLGEADDALGRELIEIPDYLTSRDAIIAVIEKKYPDLVARYLVDVLAKHYKTSHVTFAMIMCATASQLTEALLRATGKWKE